VAGAGALVLGRDAAIWSLRALGHRDPEGDAEAGVLVSWANSAGWSVLPTTAPALAASIRYSKQQALAGRPQVIPLQVRKLLAAYFPDEVMRTVRWTTPHGLNLGTVVAGWFYREGAVTLDNVVVFSQARCARDWRLWAHELTHVMQYRAMGIDGFARRYLTDWAYLEGEAVENRALVTRLVRTRAKARRRKEREPGSRSLRRNGTIVA
jgi:hypothetical protein